MVVEIKKLKDTAILPSRGSEEAAGYDLYADCPQQVIEPHTTQMIPTSLSVAIPKGYFGGIYARSGLASKQGLRPANCVGVIDSDYRGEIMVALHNDTDEERVIEHGERIAQLIIQPFLEIEFAQTDELLDTKRGSGGFGSTGTK